MSVFSLFSEMKSDIPSKVCFVTYKERSSVETALHLSNTVFIDRALVVAQSRFGEFVSVINCVGVFVGGRFLKNCRKVVSVYEYLHK